MSTRELAPDDVSTAPPPAVPLPLAGDPLVLGLPCFIVGSVALGLVLVTYVPATAVGASLAILVAATGFGLAISTVWAAAIGQSLVSAVLGIFAGFWLSYSALVLGLTHNWFGVAPGDAVKTQELFLIAWIVTISLLTIATPRLPLAFTVLFALVDLALILVLLATANASVGTQKLAGVVVFAFVAVGCYLFLNVASLATGGKALPLGPPIVRG
jgi:succinate-acetate transporter protein